MGICDDAFPNEKLLERPQIKSQRHVPPRLEKQDVFRMVGADLTGCAILLFWSGDHVWKKVTPRFPPPYSFFGSKSAEELEHALLRLVSQSQRGNRDRLAGGQRLAVCRCFIGIGQRQVGRAGLQHIDQVLVEVLTNL